MSFEEFMEVVKREVEANIEGEVRIEEINRINGSGRRGLTVLRPGCNISPTIDLDEYYAQLADGRKTEELVNEIVGIYSDSRTMRSVDVSAFYDWDKVKNFVIYRLVDPGTNSDMLKEVPHAGMLDMAKVYSIIQKSDAHGMMAEVQVTFDMLKAWDINAEELECHARENTPRELPVSVRVLKKSELFKEREVYLVSNETGCMGAAAICYDGLLEALAGQLGGDLYLLTVSVNEAIVLKKSDYGDVFAVRDILRKLYSELPKEERLSDSVYCYELKTRQIVQISDTVPAK